MVVLQALTDTLVQWTSVIAAVLIGVLTVVMALVALGPHLPWSRGAELDATAADAEEAEAEPAEG